MTEFPCTKCGACCKLAPDSVLEYYSLPKAEGGGCGHLKEDNTCAIYETRPDVCNVKTRWEKMYKLSNVKWEEYIQINVKACEILQAELEKKNLTK